jgi:prophage maintenance system killer protein
MQMNGISVTSSEDNLEGICLQLAGVCLLARKDWSLVTHLSF